MSAQDVARLCGVDVALDVFRKEEPPFGELLGSSPDRAHVSVVVPVALLERKAWIVPGEAIRLPGRERNPLARRFTTVPAAEDGRPQRPARRPRDARRDPPHPHPPPSVPPLPRP